MWSLGCRSGQGEEYYGHTSRDPLEEHYDAYCSTTRLSELEGELLTLLESVHDFFMKVPFIAVMIMMSLA